MLIYYVDDNYVEWQTIFQQLYNYSSYKWLGKYLLTEYRLIVMRYLIYKSYVLYTII